MEFIGLLGLIGLFGLMAGDKVSKKLDDIRKEFSDKSRDDELDKRVTDNEKNLGALSRDVQQLNSALQNSATPDELERLYRRVNSELDDLRRNPPRDPQISDALTKLGDNLKTTQDAVKKFQSTADDLSARLKRIERTPQSTPSPSPMSPELEQCIAEIEAERQVLSDKVAELEARPQNPSSPELEQRIADLEAERQVLSDKVAELEARPQTPSSPELERRIAELEAERQVLSKQVTEQNTVLQRYKAALMQMQMGLNAHEARLNGFEPERQAFRDRITDHETRIKNLEGSKSSTPPPTIRDFHIKKVDGQIFFTGEPSELPKRLATVQNLSPLTTFLQGANFDKRAGFLNILDNYKKNLDRFADKVKRGKFDEDNLSEEVTSAFFAVLSKYFLAPLMTAILRGGKDNPKIYGDFLAKVNEYLSSCGVYTELVEPGKTMRSKDVKNMQITPKQTDKRIKDKTIDEVEQLPYFMNYLTEDGDEDFRRFEGKMVVLKFGGGK